MKTQIWSCGGGVQSCAIGALIVSGKLPVPDLALIVDTERERSSTWAYFDAVLHPRLMDVGLDIKRVKKSEFSDVDLFGGADDDTFLPGGITQAVKLQCIAQTNGKHSWPGAGFERKE